MLIFIAICPLTDRCWETLWGGLWLCKAGGHLIEFIFSVKIFWDLSFWSPLAGGRQKEEVTIAGFAVDGFYRKAQ